RAFANDEAQNIVSLRSNGHANAYFMSSLAYRIGHQAVDADGGKNQRQRCKYAEKRHIEALLIERDGHQLDQGMNITEGNLTVDVPDVLFYLVEQSWGRARSTNGQGHPAPPRLVGLRK